MTSSSVRPCRWLELGAVANLEIADVVAGRVLHHLVGHPLDRLGRLQQRDGEVEPVAGSPRRLAASSTSMKRRSASGSYDGRATFASRASSIIVSGRSAAVEMGVQLRLGQPADQLTRQHRPCRPPGSHHHPEDGQPPSERSRAASSMPRPSVTYAAPPAICRLQRRDRKPRIASADVGPGGEIHRRWRSRTPGWCRSPGGHETGLGADTRPAGARRRRIGADRLDVEHGGRRSAAGRASISVTARPGGAEVVDGEGVLGVRPELPAAAEARRPAPACPRGRRGS